MLGFDSERSTDHDWGPRLLVFLEDEEAERPGVAVDDMLGHRCDGWGRPERRS